MKRSVGTLRPLDDHFADFVARHGGDAEPVRAAARLVSRAVGEGHICLSLPRVAGRTTSEAAALLQYGETAAAAPADEDTARRLPGLDEWLSALRAAPAVLAPGWMHGEPRRPLVLDGDGRLYLQRYWQYELDLAAGPAARGSDPDWDDAARSLARERLPRVFSSSFSASSSAGRVDWQIFAAFLALRRNLLVLSGGPGTGKTTTVARLLALPVARPRAQPGAAPRILLATPTGKAAARMAEAVEAAKAAPPSSPVALRCDDDVKAAIPDGASTLHRLLGSRPDSPYFRHDRFNPLPADVVVVDEASMVPLPLMAKLVDALPPAAKLILLGDMHQLASVEPGYVLGDVCEAGDIDRFTGECAAELAATTGAVVPLEHRGAGAALADSFVRLRYSHRFPAGGPIDRVARAVNESQDALPVLKSAADDHADVMTCWTHGDDEAVDGYVTGAYAPFVAAPTPEAALAALDRFRILCALRRGPHGVEAWNRRVRGLLGLSDDGRRPVIVTTNDYGLNLFNGDVGVVMPGGAADEPPRAWFRGPDGGLRSFAPRLLPDHETCFAMTVHKSQGSEFDDVLVVLPAVDSPVVTRELIYTAITRARRRVAMLVDDQAFARAVGRRCRADSGLVGKLRAAAAD